MNVENSQFEENLDSQGRALRDLFVQEYLKDFDPYVACIRLGFQATYATQYAQQFMTEGYVQRQIIHFTRKVPDVGGQEQADRALLENTLRQAMQHGPYASRVAAAKAFGDIKGWNKPEGGENDQQGVINALRDFAKTAPA